jgi:energy-coupling factor transporter ATP-binding protein EcfA2
MTLRAAKFEDHWRHVFARQFPTRFTRIELKNLYCLSDGSIDFKGGVAAVVGSNGVGKSTLTAAITELLSADPALVEPVYRSRLRGSAIDGIAFSAGTELRLGVRDDQTAGRVRVGHTFDRECQWLDPSILAARCLDAIFADANFDDLLEPLTPLILEEDELKIASYLVGKNYTSIQVFEISDYAGFERIPYFRVSAGGITYGSEGMGRGELSLLSAHWTLNDLSKNSILILEEPETHVSPRSQDALMNIVAKYCDEMGIWVIVTTHSPTIIRRIRRENIVFLARDQGAAVVVTEATKLDIAFLLGGGVAYKCALVVEDEAARTFLLTLLQVFDPDLYRQCEVACAGSKSEITAVMTSMPRTRDWLTLIGVYDGDLRAEIAGAKFNWPHCFLPGNVSPDELFIAMIESAPALVNSLAAELQKPLERIRMTLGHVTGIDTHDYFREFAAGVNLDITTVRKAFCGVWLQDDGNMNAAKDLISILRNAIETNIP